VASVTTWRAVPTRLRDGLEHLHPQVADTLADGAFKVIVRFDVFGLLAEAVRWDQLKRVPTVALHVLSGVALQILDVGAVHFVHPRVVGVVGSYGGLACERRSQNLPVKCEACESGLGCGPPLAGTDY
jgi:hypothetical protein